MKFLIRLAFHVMATALVFWAIEQFLFPGSFSILGEGRERYVLVALLFGVLNTFVKPVLKILMLPVQFFTLGLAGLAINGLLLIGLSFILGVLGINDVSLMVDHWLMYFVIGVVLGVANTIIHWFE